MEQPKSGPTESMSETVSVTVTDVENDVKAKPKICPECDQKSLYKVDETHWSCSDCETQFLIEKIVIR